MSTPIQPNPTTKQTEQALQNLTFDQEFGVIAAEMLGFDGTNLRRIAVDSTGVLQTA